MKFLELLDQFYWRSQVVKPTLGKCTLLETNIAILNEVLGDIELTPEEENSLMWLAGWEITTVMNIVTIFEKAERSRSSQHISRHADSR